MFHTFINHIKYNSKKSISKQIVNIFLITANQTAVDFLIYISNLRKSIMLEFDPHSDFLFLITIHERLKY